MQSADVYYNKLKHLRGHVIVLEGTISAGKTTLGKNIVDLLTKFKLKAKFFHEYVNEDLLQQYIIDMKTYAYGFQLIMQAHRINSYKNARDFANKGGIAIIDRSIIGDYAFALMQKKRGFITEAEWDIYMKIFIQENLIQPDGIIYLDCTVDTVVGRIVKRGIKCESSYDISYLQELNQTYSHAFEENHINPLIIDWNLDRSDMAGDQKATFILQQYINHFIRSFFVHEVKK